MAELTYAQVSEVLNADPKAGKLFWRTRPLHLCKDEHQMKVWNKLYAEKEALYSINSAGYKKGCIFYQQHLAHRVIWLLHTGEWPTATIDHINGVRTDNRIVNLREVTMTENLKNRARAGNNTSGFIGVHWSEKDKVWVASLTVARRYVHLGSFRTFGEAVASRMKANAEYGFHPNHGRPLKTLRQKI